MSTISPMILRTTRSIGILLLIALFISACSSQPKTVPAATISTNAPQTQAPPTQTLIPFTITPEPPVLVTSMDEIIGEWLSRCGGGSCTISIRTDGIYNIRYVHPTEGQGLTQIDKGKIIFTNDVFQLESTSGYCETMPNGSYRAYLSHIGGQLYLRFDGSQKDECADRQSMLSREMKDFGD